MKNGFVKVATVSPKVFLTSPAENADEAIRLTKEASSVGVSLLVFPELSLTGATAGELFLSETLLRGAEDALEHYLSETVGDRMLSVLGLPVRYRNKIYNCAAVCYNGELLGVVPKTHLPNSGESYEARYFSAPSDGNPMETPPFSFAGQWTVLSAARLFTAEHLPAFSVAVQLGEDLSVSDAPALSHCRAGATVICNPAASSEWIGKEESRRLLSSAFSLQNHCAVLYAGANEGESTSDAVFAGHSMILECGTVLSEQKPFAARPGELLVTEIDLGKIVYERRRDSLFSANAAVKYPNYYEQTFPLPVSETTLTRFVNPEPFLPADPSERSERCARILEIQSHALAERLYRAYCKKAVIGISGGLDSTLAILVAARAVDLLGRPRTDIIGITMPGFGTTSRTKGNAELLCEALGVELRCIPIGEAVSLHFRDIGHDPEKRDVTYENSQARERTQVLMDVANEVGGMVVGTGDLSELALGWATYNGDHMSMYSVNASLPKTLIRHVVACYADDADVRGEHTLSAVLRDILDTPVSPELLPADEKGNIAQKTEDLVGPYELHDFYLYYMLRYGYGPEKLYRLAKYALGDRYDDRNLLHWLETLTRRFFAQQFKRSCVPDGPKVGAVALSPRGDWRMPSDARSAEWLKIIAEMKRERGL